MQKEQKAETTLVAAGAPAHNIEALNISCDHHHIVFALASLLQTRVKKNNKNTFFYTPEII